MTRARALEGDEADTVTHPRPRGSIPSYPAPTNRTRPIMLRVLTLLLALVPTILHAQSWIDIRGGFRGEVKELVVTASGEIVHGTFGSGIYHSSDAGESWYRGRSQGGASLESPMSLPLGDLVADQREGEILATSMTLIYRSTDGGRGWTKIVTNLSDGTANVNIGAITRLWSDATLIGTPSGFWRSNDAMTGYDRVNGDNRPGIASRFVRTSQYIFAGTDRGIYRFTLDGALDAQGLSSGMHANAIAYGLSVEGERLYAGTDSGVYRSSDLGGSWGSLGLRSRLVRAVLPLDGDVILAGAEDGLVRTTDDGASWEVIADELAGYRVSALGRGSDGMIAAATTIGVFVSRDDGVTWRNTAHGIHAGTLEQMLGVDSATVLLREWGAASPLMRSTNAGRTWDPPTGLDDAGTVNHIARGPGRLVVAACGRGVFRSVDGGATWSATGRDSATSQVAVGPNGRILASNPQAGSLHISRDNGATWTMTERFGSYWALAIAGDGTLYAGERFGLYRSTDDGATWQRTSVRGQWIGALATDRLDLVYAGTELGLSRSTDRGATWTRLDSASPEQLVDVIAASPDGHIAIATSFDADMGLRRTTDAGMTWGKVPHDLTVLGARSISYDDGGYLYVLAHLGSGDYPTRSAVPLAPTIRAPLEPADGASGLPPYVTMRWPSPAGAIGYHLQLSGDAVLGQIRNRVGSSLHAADLRIDDSTLTSPTLEVADLTPGETWYWRVRARLDSAWDGWSPVFRFTTAGGPGGASDESAPTSSLAIELRDATLHIESARATHATATLYALDGTRVATVFDGELSAGENVVALPDLPTGAYVVVVDASTTHGVARIVIP